MFRPLQIGVYQRESYMQRTMGSPGARPVVCPSNELRSLGPPMAGTDGSHLLENARTRADGIWPGNEQYWAVWHNTNWTICQEKHFPGQISLSGGWRWHWMPFCDRLKTIIGKWTVQYGPDTQCARVGVQQYGRILDSTESNFADIKIQLRTRRKTRNKTRDFFIFTT